LLAKFEGILRYYKINAAAYHSGDLARNDCKLLMWNAKEMFASFLEVLETAIDKNIEWSEEDKSEWKDEGAIEWCKAYLVYFVLVDGVFNILHLTPEDFPNDKHFKKYLPALKHESSKL
jgi:hypothetical protein